MTAQPSRLPLPRKREPRPPAHLATVGRRLWRRVAAAFVVEDPHSLELLRLACEAIDRAAQARAIVDAEGLTIEGRFGAKTHPAVAIERDSALRAARLLRELGLGLDGIPESRPPDRWHHQRTRP